MQISDKARSVIVLLNNAADLIVVSNDRKNAAGVVKAASIFAKSNGVDIDEWMVSGFFDVINDSRPETLKSILYSIASDVAHKNKK